MLSSVLGISRDNKKTLRKKSMSSKELSSHLQLLPTPDTTLYNLGKEYLRQLGLYCYVINKIYQTNAMNILHSLTLLKFARFDCNWHVEGIQVSQDIWIYDRI